MIFHYALQTELESPLRLAGGGEIPAGTKIALIPETMAELVLLPDGKTLAEALPEFGRVMTGASAAAAGISGFAPAPPAGAQDKFLAGDGTYRTPPDTTYQDASQAVSGLMSASDKKKLDGVAAGAQVNPGVATQSANGLMSSGDKTKLDGIAAGATNTAAPPAAASAAPKAHGTAAVGTSAKYAREDHVHPSNNTDTHWTSHLYAGAGNGNANAATANGATYLILCDNTTARDRRLIRGAGSVTVTSDANGVITITGVNTTYGAMKGASASAAGAAGLVPAPAAGAANRYLRSDGTWQVPPDTNTNTWRGVQNNLTSTATDQSLSAAQGRLLANGSARDSTKMPISGNRGDTAGNENAQALSNSQTITASSRDCINLATSGAVTLAFTAAAATARAVKAISITASAATTLTVKNAVWANNGSAPVWGAAGKILVLLAHFVGGRVVLHVIDNTQ